ncbi:MAG: phosphodiester glycosidase family protein [Nocardioides sp.]
MRAPRLVLTLVTACALAVPVVAGPSAADPGPGPDKRPHQKGPQTSDGVRGAIAPYVPRALRTDPVISNEATWAVAPGVTYRQWDQLDARGSIRAYLLTIDPRTPGIRLDYAGPNKVGSTETVRDMVTRRRASAGINGDFYDIGDTGAPLGLGVENHDGLLHGRKNGWNRAFMMKDGVPSIGLLPMKGTVAGIPWMKIKHRNSPTIFDGEIGAYDYRWGDYPSSTVVEGQEEAIREVVVRGNRVVSTQKYLTEGKPVRGTVLIGRGEGARQLGVFHRGDKARIGWTVRRDPDMAITGNKILLLHGVRRVVDDRELHPRTAIGIDQDTGQILMLVVDGRQSFSRGYTMVELANLMQTLGAEDALNLDGGGSSTMLAFGPDGLVEVRNSPSDGFERLVGNGIVVNYSPPPVARD